MKVAQEGNHSSRNVGTMHSAALREFELTMVPWSHNAKAALAIARRFNLHQFSVRALPRPGASGALGSVWRPRGPLEGGHARMRRQRALGERRLRSEARLPVGPARVRLRAGWGGRRGGHCLFAPGSTFRGLARGRGMPFLVRFVRGFMGSRHQNSRFGLWHLE